MNTILFEKLCFADEVLYLRRNPNISTVKMWQNNIWQRPSYIVNEGPCISSLGLYTKLSYYCIILIFKTLASQDYEIKLLKSELMFDY